MPKEKLSKETQEKIVELRTKYLTLTQEEALAIVRFGDDKNVEADAEDIRVAQRELAALCNDYRLVPKQKFFELVRANVNRVWDHPGLVKKYAGHDETRIWLKEISYCSAVAIGFHGAGKLDVNQTMDDLIPEYLDMKEKLKVYEKEPNENGQEVLRLQARVNALENLLAYGGPGRGNKS